MRTLVAETLPRTFRSSGEDSDLDCGDDADWINPNEVKLLSCVLNNYYS